MFDNFLITFLPGSKLSPQRDAIRKQYNCTAIFNSDFTDCISTVIRDASFTCNTRDLFESFPKKSYMMEYAFPLPGYAYHASDLIPLFMNNRHEAEALLRKSGLDETLAGIYAGSLEDKVIQAFQEYFASFSIAGNPNNLTASAPFEWPVANGDGDQLSDVMRVKWDISKDKIFELITDNQNAKSTCSFWKGIAKGIVTSGQASSEDGIMKLQLPGVVDEL